jgi:hypothetical protein
VSHRIVRTTVIPLACASGAILAIASAAFLLIDAARATGYGMTVVYTSFGFAMLGGLFGKGATTRGSEHHEFANLVTSSPEALRAQRDDQERGMTLGLVLFFAALATGAAALAIMKLAA